MTSADSGVGSRGRRALLRVRRVRRASLWLVATILVPTVAVAGPGAPAAHANSLAAIGANAAILTADAAGALNTLNQSPASDPLSPDFAMWQDEVDMARGGTMATSGAGSVQAKPRPGSKLGTVINTVAELGGLVFGLTQDAPEFPGGSAGGTEPEYSGSEQVGWTNLPGWQVIPHATAAHAVWLASKTGQPLAAGHYIWYKSRTGTNWMSICSPGNVQCGPFSRSASGGTFDVAVMRSPNSPASKPADVVSMGEMLLAPYPGTLANPNPVTDPAAVPRYVESTAHCKNPVDGSITTLTSVTPTFTYTPGTAMDLPPVEPITCPPGTFLDSGTHEVVTEGSTERVPLAEPYKRPQWVEDQARDYPECFPIGSTKCQLELWKKPSAAGDPELNCHTIAPGAQHPCLSWASDPNRANRYECKFGGFAAPLQNCLAYENLFKPASTLTASPDPATEVPKPRADVDPTPGATPGLGDCVPGWADLLSPWWMFKATACALSWAFVPDPSTWGWEDLWAQLRARPPFSIILDLGAAVQGIADGYSNAGGCGILADFRSDDMPEAVITCAQVKSVPGYGALYGLVSAGLYALTALGLWKMFSNVLQDGQ